MAALNWRSAAVLAAVMGAALLLVLALYALLAQDIRAHQHAYATQQLRSLQQELAPDAALPDAPIRLTQPLPASRLHALYALYAGDKLAAVLVHAEALDGYQGGIDLLLGVTPAATAPRLRVLRHQETPGLADFLNHTPQDAYDGVSGASISATALTRTATAVQQWLTRCLRWQAVRGEEVLSAACRAAE